MATRIIGQFGRKFQTIMWQTLKKSIRRWLTFLILPSKMQKKRAVWFGRVKVNIGHQSLRTPFMAPLRLVVSKLMQVRLKTKWQWPVQHASIHCHWKKLKRLPIKWISHSLISDRNWQRNKKKIGMWHRAHSQINHFVEKLSHSRMKSWK